MRNRQALQDLKRCLERHPAAGWRVVDAHHRDLVLDGVNPAGVQVLAGDRQNLTVRRPRRDIGLDGSGRLQSGVAQTPSILSPIFWMSAAMTVLPFTGVQSVNWR